MLALRASEARGKANFGWLDSRHSFSFGQYYDPQFMGFRALRVINEDKVLEGSGFPTHGHKDMEIFTLVLDGALAHKDSMGNGTTILPGEVQIMSAGTGIEHSEYNAARQTSHFLQIWILPDRAGITPRYDQKAFPREERRNALKLVLSPDAAEIAREGAILLNQDGRVFLGQLDAGASLTQAADPARHIWVQIVKGTGTINGEAYRGGDGIALWKEEAVTISAETETDFVFFDLK
jgi:quercetin 2,3-dioxygenase